MYILYKILREMSHYMYILYYVVGKMSFITSHINRCETTSQPRLTRHRNHQISHRSQQDFVTYRSIFPRQNLFIPQLDASCQDKCSHTIFVVIGHVVHEILALFGIHGPTTRQCNISRILLLIDPFFHERTLLFQKQMRLAKTNVAKQFLL